MRVHVLDAGSMRAHDGLYRQAIRHSAVRDRADAHSAHVAETDVQALRDQGFDDTDIPHITEVVGYLADVNRIVSGLGVPLEDRITDD